MKWILILVAKIKIHFPLKIASAVDGKSHLRLFCYFQDSPYLRFVNVGLKRGMGLEREDYHPWSLPLIKKIFGARGLTAKDKLLRKSILVQFWCMLRLEEIIACKLTVTEGKLSCKVAQSKADQDAIGRKILLNATGEWACPRVRPA